MKKILIISPYFPPCNAADMQRIRMSLPYFNEFGWATAVVCVHPEFCEVNKDPLLSASVPANVQIHYVKPIAKKWTAKLGLGSIAIRSLNSYRKKVNDLLNKEKFDLIYFSTTQFPVCILGNYWKRKYGIPYVIDMQDPWHSDFYKNKPKAEQPPKYWFSYRLNKWLEPLAMKEVGGIIAVSQAYIDTLKTRYTNLKSIPSKVITFGAFETDFKLAKEYASQIPSVLERKVPDEVAIVYVGRGGFDMKDSINLLFQAFKFGLDKENALFKKIHFYFLGTSYASAGKGIKTIYPIAIEKGVQDFVTEDTDRLPFYQSLNTLLDADLLFISGSNDPQYTASKIYPYILAKKPLLAIFHPKSSAVDIIRQCNAGKVITFDEVEDVALTNIYNYLRNTILKQHDDLNFNEDAFKPYTAKQRTLEQVMVFNEVIN